MPITKKILSYLLKATIKSIVVVEVIEIKSDNIIKTLFNLLIISRKKQKITIEKKIIHSDIENLEYTISEKEIIGLPILTFINSNKVLHKNVPVKNESELLNEVAPGIDPEVLYHQQYKFFDNTIFISAVRRTFIEKILEKFHSQRKRIIDLYISPSSFFSIHQIAFKRGTEDIYSVNLENFNFEFKNNDLINFSVLNSQNSDSVQNKFVELNEEHIESSIFILFSYGLQYFLDQSTEIGINKSEIITNRAIYYFNVASKFIILRSAIILFTLLLTSSYLFSTYSSENESLNALNSIEIKANENQIKNDSATKKYIQLLEENGMATSSIISYYADEITSSLPDDIYLRKLEIHPANKSATSENNVTFLNNTILITGNCYSSNDLNEWIKNMRSKKWVTEVIIREFIQRNENDLGYFLIEVKK